MLMPEYKYHFGRTCTFHDSFQYDNNLKFLSVKIIGVQPIKWASSIDYMADDERGYQEQIVST